MAAGANAGKVPYNYYSVGDPSSTVTTTQTRPQPSYVLMGGGPDVDEAFRWMIKQAGIVPGTGGRLVVIRATGDGAYDPYIYYSASKSRISTTIVDGWVGGAALGLSSVETLVIPSIAAANDPTVNAIVARANVVWIAGGDQSDYIKFWKGQKLETTLKTLMTKNVPIGGTSAGLAVLGNIDFTAMNGTVTSSQALTNPYNTYMTFDPNPMSLTGGFISPPVFANTIFDSHFDSRDRMGRLITFTSRMIGPYVSSNQTFGCPGGFSSNNSAKGIGIGVETALAVTFDPAILKYTGERFTNISTTTESAVYFINVTQGPTVCASGKPLTVPASSIAIRKLNVSGKIIDMSDWNSISSLPYTNGSVNAGILMPANPY
jgi:cyanophycinase-like exopeptidase